MPARVEDEYFRRALRMMGEHERFSPSWAIFDIHVAQPDSPYFQSVMQSVFNQPVRPTRGFLYDMHEDGADHASLNGVVRDKLAEIFRLHGAVDMEPSLLIPVTSTDDEDKVMLLDKHGDPVVLPDNGILPLARLAARKAVTRIKRYHISDVYKPK
jgi:translation initiation factor 2-alpha kinase 4